MSDYKENLKKLAKLRNKDFTVKDLMKIQGIDENHGRTDLWRLYKMDFVSRRKVGNKYVYNLKPRALKYVDYISARPETSVSKDKLIDAAVKRIAELEAEIERLKKG